VRERRGAAVKPTYAHGFDLTHSPVPNNGAASAKGKRGGGAGDCHAEAPTLDVAGWLWQRDEDAAFAV